MLYLIVGTIDYGDNVLFGCGTQRNRIPEFIAVVFAVFTGTVFGFYPALKASKLVPVEALNEE